MANYHPTPEMLTDFSAGNLQLSHALCVSVHTQHCNECRINLQRLNSIATTLFDELEPASLPDRLKDSVFSQLDNEYVEEQLPVKRNTTNIPKALQQFVTDSYESLSWKNVSPAIQSAHLCTDVNGSKVNLMRIRAGGKIPMHTHTGKEYTLLLEGSFSDENGLYNEGDFLVRDERHKHRPVVSKDRECLCLAVTDAPIKLTGVFTRLINPLLRRGHFSY
jgi:putative transcriptional regulator